MWEEAKDRHVLTGSMTRNMEMSISSLSHSSNMCGLPLIVAHLLPC